VTILESGKKIPADTVLYSAGRQGVTDQLNVAAAGINASNRGRVEVNEHFQTEVEHIYAVGDVIGFPALAATAMEQGRRATYHAFGEPVGNKLGDLQPIGIYTILEVSYVGRTEGQLTAEKVPFEVGVSRYRELARGAILGDSYGMLKMLVHAESRELLGLHVFGTNATELVHIGQTVMGCGGTVDYLVDAVFKYPTLAESYKVAALDAVNKMRAIAKVTQTGAYRPFPNRSPHCDQLRPDGTVARQTPPARPGPTAATETDIARHSWTFVARSIHESKGAARKPLPFRTEPCGSGRLPRGAAAARPLRDCRKEVVRVDVQRAGGVHGQPLPVAHRRAAAHGGRRGAVR